MTISAATGAAARSFAYGAAAMGTRMPAFAATAVVLTAKPRVQGSDATNGGTGASLAWGPPD
jgi:hypothetical protein